MALTVPHISTQSPEPISDEFSEHFWSLRTVKKVTSSVTVILGFGLLFLLLIGVWLQIGEVEERSALGVLGLRSCLKVRKWLEAVCVTNSCSCFCASFRATQGDLTCQNDQAQMLVHSMDVCHPSRGTKGKHADSISKLPRQC